MLMLKSILRRTKEWIFEHKEDIILFIGVVLVSLASFALGYLTAKVQ